jgi:hypothetical protein
VENKNGRGKRIRSIWKEYIEENIWIIERKRVMEIRRKDEVEYIIKGEKIVRLIK